MPSSNTQVLNQKMFLEFNFNNWSLDQYFGKHLAVYTESVWESGKRKKTDGRS